jgi:adenylate cyclase
VRSCPCATVHPISSIRVALAGVEAGRRERERIRDLFGRQVGVDVARQALASDVRLGGAVAEAAVLFVDLVGSTALAASRPPEDVVATLNRFFADCVTTVEEHGGWINKFQGDAALAIFGAPVAVADACGRALRCARTLDDRLRRHADAFQAAMGVAAGPAVAGHIGAERRFEYTVIGDPVNQAARLTDLAKLEPGRVLASGAALDRAEAGEASQWTRGELVLLRGRAEQTLLARPATAPAAARASSRRSRRG